MKIVDLFSVHHFQNTLVPLESRSFRHCQSSLTKDILHTQLIRGRLLTFTKVHSFSHTIN